MICFRKNKEEFLKSLTRDNTQLIMNAIFNLPTKSSEDGVFATLPEPITVIPREKPVSTKMPIIEILYISLCDKKN